MSSLPISDVAGAPLSADQKVYLEGFFAGVRNAGLSFEGVQANPAAQSSQASTADLIFEERVKRELHPLDAYSTLLEHAAGNRAPDREATFRFKWQGLFFLSPNKEAFMARLRIPGGLLRTFQIREIAKTAKELTTGYIQITTRANLQIRMIESKNCPSFLQRIQSVGLHCRGAGADNIRNITINPTAGVDPYELIDTTPFCKEIADLIISTREFYDLPRKFNIAFDGGGLIGTLEDTNDIGLSAVRLTQPHGDLPSGVYFRAKLGGATGHGAFANDIGVLVKPSELIEATVAMLRVYIRNGNRGDRKKARLKHLLEKWSLAEYLEATEKILGRKLARIDAGMILETSKLPQIPHSHIGVHQQKQPGLFYIGVGFPAGQVTSKQLIRIAEIADLYGSGEARLTVWQNLILPNIPEAHVETVRKALARIGLYTEVSNLKSGVIACTGNSYCKFASSNTKGFALDLIAKLEKKLELDRPVNIHITGCPNSCAQHYIGDIGLLATKVKVGGETVEGFHIFVGGGFGGQKAIGRQVFNGLSCEDSLGSIERMLRAYQKSREGDESFQDFTKRHDLNQLQVLFSGI